MTTTLQQLRAAIIATNEDIMKLQFGCYARDRVDGYLFVQCVGDWQCVDGIGPMMGSFARGVDWEILGRKIGITDVLLAIFKQHPSYRTNLILESSGQFICTKYHGATTSKEAGPTWNLSQDDLSLQSEETITFLHSILCKK